VTEKNRFRSHPEGAKHVMMLRQPHGPTWVVEFMIQAHEKKQRQQAKWILISIQ
jgi:hypothetical protein